MTIEAKELDPIDLNEIADGGHGYPVAEMLAHIAFLNKRYADDIDELCKERDRWVAVVREARQILCGEDVSLLNAPIQLVEVARQVVADRDAHAIRAQEQTERVSALEVERDLLRVQNAAMLDTLSKLEKQVAEAIFGLGVSS